MSSLPSTSSQNLRIEGQEGGVKKKKKTRCSASVHRLEQQQPLKRRGCLAACVCGGRGGFFYMSEVDS